MKAGCDGLGAYRIRNSNIAGQGFRGSAAQSDKRARVAPQTVREKAAFPSRGLHERHPTSAWFAAKT